MKEHYSEPDFFLALKNGLGVDPTKIEFVMCRPAVEPISFKAPVIPFARQKARATKAILAPITCKQADYRVCGQNPYLIHGLLQRFIEILHGRDHMKAPHTKKF